MMRDLEIIYFHKKLLDFLLFDWKLLV